MKLGPNWFTCTLSSAGPLAPGGPVYIPGVVGATQTYQMQTVSVSITSVPLDGRGLYNKSVQLVGTFTAITNVAVDASLDPQTLLGTTGTWYTIGNLSTPTWLLIHSGNIRAMRARTVAVSSSDNFGILWMADDAG